jgi:hypothetical protein
MDFIDYFFEIIKLQDNEIDNYINKRLSELKNKEKRVIGFNSDTSVYNGFFDNKIRINMVFTVQEKEKNIILRFSGLTVNDKNIYRTLIEEIRSSSNPFCAIINAVDKYLLLKDKRRDENMEEYGRIRNDIIYRFSEGTNRTVPIQVFNMVPLAKCGEIAAVAHNMFKFLGLDADYVMEVRPNGNHAYNIFYPFGREKYAIIYDGMRLSTNHPLLFYIDKERKQKLFSGESIEVDEKDMNTAVKIILGAKLISNRFNYRYGMSSNNYTEGKAPDLSPFSKKQKLIFRKVDKEIDKEE